jgi:hypothetical protein
MMRAMLHRETSDAEGTFGVLSADTLRLFTVELPWRDNATDVSCIPAGRYLIRKTYSPRFKRRMVLIEDVPGPRLGCRVHAANFPHQLNGCIAPGERRGVMDGKRGVFLSWPAVRRFEEWVGDEARELEIIDG